MDKEKLIEWLKKLIAHYETREENKDFCQTKIENALLESYYCILLEVQSGAFEKEPCEWCKTFLHLGFYPIDTDGDFRRDAFEKLIFSKPNFCPNCGRSLSTNK